MKEIMLKLDHRRCHGHAFDLEEVMGVVCEDEFCELDGWEWAWRGGFD